MLIDNPTLGGITVFISRLLEALTESRHESLT